MNTKTALIFAIFILVISSAKGKPLRPVGFFQTPIHNYEVDCDRWVITWYLSLSNICIKIIKSYILRRYFHEFDPCLVLKVTPEMEPLIMDDILHEDFVPSEEFEPDEHQELLRLYRWFHFVLATFW